MVLDTALPILTLDRPVLAAAGKYTALETPEPGGRSRDMSPESTRLSLRTEGSGTGGVAAVRQGAGLPPQGRRRLAQLFLQDDFTQVRLDLSRETQEPMNRSRI